MILTERFDFESGEVNTHIASIKSSMVTTFWKKPR